MKYSEAIQQARLGNEIHRGSARVRFLTPEEAAPIILARTPSRRVLVDEKGRTRLVDKNGNKGVADQNDAAAHVFVDAKGKSRPVEPTDVIEVEVYADAVDPRRFGLFDVSQSPPVEFHATDDDIYEPVELDEEGNEKPRVLRADWHVGIDQTPIGGHIAAPEPVSAEAVDEALKEEGAPQ